MKLPEAESPKDPEEARRLACFRECLMVPTPTPWAPQNKPKREDLATLAKHNIDQALWLTEGDIARAKEALFDEFPSLKAIVPSDIPKDAVIPDNTYALLVETARQLEKLN